jgi:type IX secretion system substrate protein/beta-propeller repeat-containing protein
MKKLLLIFMLALVGLSINAQIPIWQWAREGICSSIGSGDGVSVASDASGNIYFTGFYGDTITFGSYTLMAPSNSVNTFVTKYNTSGNVIWSKSSSVTMGFGNSASIATDPFGNVYITGNFASPTIKFGAYTLINGGNQNIFLTKYDSSGNVLWAKAVSGLNNDGGSGVATDAHGNCFITGYFSSPSLVFGIDTINNMGSYDIFLAKYDSAGNALWAKSAGGNDSDEGNGIVTDLFGNIYLTGNFYSTIAHFGTDSVINNSGVGEFFLAKYDSVGNSIWVRNGIGTMGDGGYGVATDPQGNAFSTGFFYSPTIIFDTDSLINSNLCNIFIVKYDSSGNILWAKSSSGNISAMGYSIISDEFGNTYIEGGMGDTVITFDTVTLHAPTNSSDAVFIIKYNSSGNALYGFALASGGEDNSGLTLDPFGNIFIGSDFDLVNPFIIGNDSLMINSGATDAEVPYIAKLGFRDAGIPQVNSKYSISLYPNPTSGTFTLSCSLPQSGISNYELGIMDVLGRMVYTQAIVNQQSSIINVSQLSNGIYFYQLTNGKETYRGKFVKE